jgi:hypothetical protein
VHVAPVCTMSEEGSDHFESYVRNLSLHFCKRLFPRLESMTSTIIYFLESSDLRLVRVGVQSLGTRFNSVVCLTSNWGKYGH